MIYKPLIKYNCFLEKLHSFFNSYLDSGLFMHCVVSQDCHGLYWIGFSNLTEKAIFYDKPIRCEADFSDEFQIGLKEFFEACYKVDLMGVRR